MKTLQKRVVSAFIVASLSVLLAACGGQDFAYQDSNDMKPGSGLFSGEDGVFTLYSGRLGTVEGENGSAE